MVKMLDPATTTPEELVQAAESLKKAKTISLVVGAAVLVGLLILLKSVPEWAAFFDKYALAMQPFYCVALGTFL